MSEDKKTPLGLNIFLGLYFLTPVLLGIMVITIALMTLSKVISGELTGIFLIPVFLIGIGAFVFLPEFYKFYKKCMALDAESLLILRKFLLFHALLFLITIVGAIFPFIGYAYLKWSEKMKEAIPADAKISKDTIITFAIIIGSFIVLIMGILWQMELEAMMPQVI